MKRFILLTITLMMMISLFGQSDIDDLIFGPEKQDQAPAKDPKLAKPTDDDFIKVNFAKKDARLAMLFSALLPGAGQYYADKSALSTWIFPIVEVGLIGGIIYYNVSGNKRTDEFEKYATGEIITQTFNYTVDGVDYSYTYQGPRYQRSYQNLTQNVLISFFPSDIYDSNFFRLDATNTQHFYEDIGKYNKYIFGWADWFYNFATDPMTGNFVLDNPNYYEGSFPGLNLNAVWIWADTQYDYSRRWTANVQIDDFLNGLSGNHISPGTTMASPMRQEYIQMRKDANSQFSIARIMTLALAFNHLASAVDAVMVTNKVNKTYITQNNLQLKYYTAFRDGRVSPSLGFSWSF